MSTSDLYILNQRSTRWLAEFRNGWGTGMRCWDHLAARYIPQKPLHSLEPDHLQRVWDLAHGDLLKRHELITLCLTFDRAYVPFDMIKETASACARFGRECNKPGYVNNWPAVAETFEAMADRKFHHKARGICLSSTSVSDHWCEPDVDWLENAWPISELVTNGRL